MPRSVPDEKTRKRALERLQMLADKHTETGVAKKLGVSQPLISSYLRGRVKLTVDRCAQIAGIAGELNEEAALLGMTLSG